MLGHDDTPARCPASIVVLFPYSPPDADGAPDGTYYQKQVFLTSLGLSSLISGSHPGSKYIKSSAEATGGTLGTPANQTFLDSLANQWATDYYRWLLAQLDVVYAEAIDWDLEGFHDVEWCSLPGAGDTTRVRPAPVTEYDLRSSNAAGKSSVINVEGDTFIIDNLSVTNIFQTLNTSNIFIYSQTLQTFSTVITLNSTSILNVFAPSFFYGSSIFYGQLCIPTHFDYGPPLASPTCASISLSLITGSLWVFNPATGAWGELCLCNQQSGYSGGSGDDGDTAGPCCECDVVPTQWAMSPSGVSNDSCSACAGYNGNFTLTKTSGCIWNTGDANPCAGPGGMPTWALVCLGGGVWELTAQGVAGLIIATYRNSGTFNCLGSNTMVLNSVPEDQCATWPSQIILTPV